MPCIFTPIMNQCVQWMCVCVFCASVFDYKRTKLQLLLQYIQCMLISQVCVCAFVCVSVCVCPCVCMRVWEREKEREIKRAWERERKNVQVTLTFFTFHFYIVILEIKKWLATRIVMLTDEKYLWCNNRYKIIITEH